MKNLYFALLLTPFFMWSCNSDQKESVQDTKGDAPEGYELVWSDEFDYEGLPDQEKWSYDTIGNSWGWGNNELQYYTHARQENAWVSDGHLTITAKKEKWEGKEYTSARLISKDKGDWLYGKFEVRAKLASGRGLWPAIWMLPTDWKYGGWPKSGEIDIMEHVGYEPDSIFASAHTESYNHTIGTNKTSAIKVKGDIYNDFHVYAVEWNKDEYSVFMDGEKYFTFKNEGTGYKVWPYDQRFHMLLNVAVGGNWGGKHGIDDTVFPKTMEVDYVRVYQKNEPAQN